MICLGIYLCLDLRSIVKDSRLSYSLPPVNELFQILILLLYFFMAEIPKIIWKHVKNCILASLYTFVFIGVFKQKLTTFADRAHRSRAAWADALLVAGKPKVFTLEFPNYNASLLIYFLTTKIKVYISIMRRDMQFALR